MSKNHRKSEDHGPIKRAFSFLFILLFIAAAVYSGYASIGGVTLPIDILNGRTDLNPSSGLLSLELAAVSGITINAPEEDPYWAIEEKISGNLDPTAVLFPLAPSSAGTNSPKGPEVLVYSTHSNEAFRNVEEDKYVESSKWRTTDLTHSILKVAETVSKSLSDHGVAVLFDRTDHELGKYYTTSYNRSLETINKNKSKYSSLSVFIDIHRDASNETVGPKDYVVIDGKQCARIMVVIGTGEGKTGAGFKEKPDWEKNMEFAQKITDELNKIHPKLARPVRKNTGRYNQHVSTQAVAIEVGHNYNTLEQALNSAPYLAKALAEVLK